jgi:hypothetical protein
MTLLTNIFAAFGLFCFVIFCGTIGLFISASIKLDRDIKADRARQQKHVTSSNAVREAEAIILRLL